MKNQPNEMVTLEWLLPLVNQQLTPMFDGWQPSATPERAHMATTYHQISGVLIMANMPRLGSLAHHLSLLGSLDIDGVDSNATSRPIWHIGRLAHQLLHYELSQYVQTGSYRRTLIDRTIDKLKDVLKDMGHTPSLENPESNARPDMAEDTAESYRRINITLPDESPNVALQSAQYQQLLLAWRQHVTTLLIANRNDQSTLTHLATICRYLWQALYSRPHTTTLSTSTSADYQLRLWYLSELWLQALTNNLEPTPKHYAAILSRLDHAFDVHVAVNSADSDDEDHVAPLDAHDLSPSLYADMIEGLIVDIYIQISSLEHLDSNTQTVLSHLSEDTHASSTFLPRILTEIESVLSSSDTPKTLVSSLNDIKQQLARRGWTRYEQHVEHILDELTSSIEAARFAQDQDAIEQQLQTLYSDIYHIEQSIRFDQADAVSDTLDDDASTPEPNDTVASDAAMRQLRINVETIKNHFNDYIQHQTSNKLPEVDAFVEVSQALEDMRLPSVRAITDGLGDVFAELAAHQVDAINWRLTQALAESLTAVELLLDYLAQQVFDHALLVQAQNYLDEAQRLTAKHIADPTISVDSYLPSGMPRSQMALDVVRYDDSGEIAASTDRINSETNSMDTTGGDSHPLPEVSEALQAAREKLPTDDFTMDDEIRDIFIEEATEVLADLDDFIPIWQQDPQDLSPLIEVRRGFHTLKGSGRMVGAFSVAEVAWAIESMLNRVLDNALPVSDEVVALVTQSTDQLPILIADFSAMQPPSIDPALTILQAQNLMSGLPVLHGLHQSEVGADTVNLSQADADHPVEVETVNEQRTLAQEIKADSHKSESAKDDSTEDVSKHDTLVDGDMSESLPDVLIPIIDAITPLPQDADDADPDIKEIFIEEATEVLAEITPLYEAWHVNSADLSGLTEIRRGFHTLKGSGRMVGAHYSAELAWTIENMLNRALDHTITLSEDMKQLIADVLAAYPELVDVFAKDSTENASDTDTQSASESAYPAVIPIWAACATAYSKGIYDFDYAALRAQWQQGVQADNTSYDQPAHSDLQESLDSTLQTMQSVNDIMAEAQWVTAQSVDEQEFCKIFIDEARGLLGAIRHFVTEHQNEPSVEVSDEIVRAFHTLRAASGSSALSAISEVSATIEHSLEQLQQHDTLMSSQHLQTLSQSVTLIEGYLNTYENHASPYDLSSDDQNHQELASLKAIFDDSSALPAADDNKPSIGQLLDANIDDLLNADRTLKAALQAEDSAEVHAYIGQQRAQIASLLTKTTMSAKFIGLLDALDGAYQYVDSDLDAARDLDVQETLLAGHEQLIGLFDALAGSMSLKVNPIVLEQLQAINQRDTAPDADDSVLEAAPEVRSVQAPEMQLEMVDTDIELLEIFLEEAQDIDHMIAQAFGKWGADISNMTTIKVLQRHLHTIKGGARMAGISSIGDLTHAAERVYEAFVEHIHTPTPQWHAIMQRVQDTLSLQIDYITRYQESFFASELTAELMLLLEGDRLAPSVCLTLPALQSEYSGAEEVQTASDQASEEAEALSLDTLIAMSWPDGLPDPDILEVFLEEAEELVGSSSKYLQLFLSNISDTVALQALQRDLHTIKGGARMVAANGIADLAHEMETVYEELAIRRRPATKMISQLLVKCHDWLADAVFVLQHQINPEMPSVLIVALQAFSRDPDSLKQVPSASLQAQIGAILAAKAKREAVQGVEDISQMPSMSGSFTEQAQSVSDNEMIRISGGLIEHMINLSGESAINRARIDMGMSSLTGSIEEMGVTVQRLADQLRRMESELEAQILSQIDEDLINMEDFDPLEMDQYSSLNQLSKSLSESASDLVDINSTLLEKTRDSESLLLQLSRTQTELQDGLMNSRMVPFARLTPRLERIVRQTASELNKSVELTIINADDEMDRTILERITSPLEHMLRNAVDHGIESVQARVSANKDRSGHIKLEVLREGSEVVIHLSDDGRGINVDAVRSKAITQGLIEADDQSLTDIDVMQYIFNAGLTTTNEVTQISGRGVGMDVVISEIRQLGGVVSVTSKPNQGSQFTIRVPLTVAVSDALVVRAADRNYAIPLAQIERVVRINPEKLYDYYQSQAATLNIEGADYRVRYLNDLLSGNKLNELMVTTNSSLPVIIVKSRSGQRLALQVDQIEGSRIEVVVKPLGRQLSHLAGISAATIMGDGSVMMILDLITLLRSAPTLKEVGANQKPRPRTGQVSVQPTILVVDDSVTVRKVTSRLLERNGFKAMVAKDGIDAIEILQETTPDLMLLDIEMPRMDGFEVATQVRHNKRLQQIPIIMITSRTGEKHRTRALEAGVNDYMGKPFQENALLEKIQALLDPSGQQPAVDKNKADSASRHGVSYEG